MDSLPWRVLHVTANHEKRVAQHLAVRSVEHYVPLFRERSKWSDRTVELEKPLFTGYVFVRLRPGSKLPVISTPGVIRLLGEDLFETVSGEEIERIRLALSNGYLLLPHSSFPVGTDVRVRGGVFDGVRGVVAEIRQRCRVVIRVSALQQSFSLEADVNELDIIPSPQHGNQRAGPGIGSQAVI